jgi:periplasmic serine protease, Do/DeqQ family
MKNSLKLFIVFLVTAIVSAGVSTATYSYLSKNRTGNEPFSAFHSQPTKLVAYGEAAENTDFTIAAENSIHAVVHIKSVVNNTAAGSPRYIDPFEFFFGFGQGNRQYQPQPKVGFGSGVIISSDGYIMTNNHVIKGADEIEVTTNDNKTYKARLVGGDEATDIALLKIEADNLPLIPFGDSDKLKVGEWVLAVGNPFNLTSTVTAGIVSAKGRGNIFARSGNSQMKVESFIQTDAAVNPGNSGGALVNIKGELVGINTAIYSETGNFAGYSFAVPISIAGKVASDLKKHGAVQRAMLGVSIQNVSDAKKNDKDIDAKIKTNEGAYVAGFSNVSAARDAGMEVGDVIVAVNDVTVKTVSELQEQINRYNPGTNVKVKVLRNNSEKTLNVELKNQKGGTDVVKNVSGTELLGGAFQDVSKETKRQYGINYGIEVTGVTSGKLKDAGITKGFIILSVNERNIGSVDDFEKIVDTVMKQNAEDRGLFIKGFYPNGRVKFYAINLSD